jgi:hypothetical protein
MTEQEWLASADAGAMLRSLIARWSARQRQAEPVELERLRLFGCACCRRLWDLLEEEDREAVRLAELHARSAPAGLGPARKAHRVAGNRVGHAMSVASRDATPAGRAELLAAWARNLLKSAVWSVTRSRQTQAAQAHREAASAAAFRDRARAFAALPAGAPALAAPVDWRETSPEELAAQAELLRDIAGNPFRPLQPRAWPAHVAGLAASCDAALPQVSEQFLVLADALEDLGEAEAAAHCRQALHVRGCHVLGWVLGQG